MKKTKLGAKCFSYVQKIKEKGSQILFWKWVARNAGSHSNSADHGLGAHQGGFFIVTTTTYNAAFAAPTLPEAFNIIDLPMQPDKSSHSIKKMLQSCVEGQAQVLLQGKRFERNPRIKWSQTARHDIIKLVSSRVA